MKASELKAPRRMVSIIVPCRNEASHIATFLQDLLAQNAGDREIEVIVADGMSDDGTREIIDAFARKDQRIRLIDNPERHVSTALNRAIKQVRGDVVLRADVHSRYAKDYVHQCIKALETTGADNVGGAARTVAEGGKQIAIALAYNSPYSVGGAKFHDEDYEGWVDTVPYGCWHATFFDRLGLFDEDLIRNQDDELNFRTLLAGGRIWQSRDIKSWYKPRSSMRALFRQYLQYGYWKVLVIKKHKGAAALRHWVPFAAIVIGMSLGIAGLLIEEAWVVLLAMITVYLLGLFLGTLHICVRAGEWRVAHWIPIALAAFHFGYGIGFVLGTVDFLIMGRGASALMAKLTR